MTVIILDERGNSFEDNKDNIVVFLWELIFSQYGYYYYDRSNKYLMIGVIFSTIT